MSSKSSVITPAQVVKNINVDALTVMEFVQPPSLAIPWHRHESATILFVLKGKVDEVFKTRSYECVASSMLIRPPEEMHAHQYGQAGAHCLVIQIHQQKAEAIKETLQILDRVAYYQNSSLQGFAIRMCKELQIMDAASELAIEGLALEMIAQAYRQDASHRVSTPPRWLLHAREFIHEEYTRRLPLSEIARSVGVNAKHLAETFRKHYNCTIGEYIRRLRLEQAARELRQSDKSILEIAVAAGFYDQSHFTHLFKQYFGIPPSKLRAVKFIPEIHTKSRR